MSILIKGMDMPEHCYECLLRQGNCCLLLYEAVPPTVPLKRLADCPLVEIPTPHGRLIDASELDKCWEEKEDISEDVDFKILYKCVLAISKYAPTILEEEE